jgi:hypothetical protein
MADSFGALFDDQPEAIVASEAPAAVAALCPPAIMAARAQLNPVRAPSSVMPLIGAALLCVGAAFCLVCAVILGPPNLGPDITVSKPIPELRAPIR